MWTSLMALSLALGAANAPEVFTLRTAAPICDIAFEDINADGLTDIAVLCSKPNTEPLVKYLAIFAAGEGAEFPETPTTRLRLEPEVGAVFFAETNGEAPREAVAVEGKKAAIYTLSDGTWQKAGETELQSLIPEGAQKPSFLPDAAADLTGDGIDEWIIPVSGGFAIHGPGEELARLKVDATSTISHGSNIRISHNLPQFKVFDSGDSGPKGLAFLSNEYADFAYGENWNEKKRIKLPKDEGPNIRLDAQLHDINGDDLPDIILTQTKGKTELSVRTRVYLARSTGAYPEAPDAEITADGAYAQPVFKDVNGDELLDILFIKIPFGLKLFINYFMWGKVNVDVDIYEFRQGGYPSEPNSENTISIKAPENRDNIVYTLGDFDGDDRLDAAFGSGENSLAVHTGEESRFISRSPWVTLDMQPFGKAQTAELNNNGRDDIILIDTSQDELQTIHVILF